MSNERPMPDGFIASIGTETKAPSGYEKMDPREYYERQEQKIRNEKAAVRKAEEAREERWINGTFTAEDEKYFISKTKAKYGGLNNWDLIYDYLRMDNTDPWMHINRCLKQAPVKVNDPDHFKVEQFYTYLVPKCLMEWDWYNDPRVVLSARKVDAAYTFSTPSAKHTASVVERKIDETADAASREIKDVLKASEIPFYVTAGIIGVVSLAYITSRVT